MEIKVIEELMTINVATLGETKHYAEDRTCRKMLIEYIGGLGKGLYTWRVLINGREEQHTLTDNGIIVVSNTAGMIVTALVARPNQIRRYFDETPKGLDKLIEQAKKRQYLGYNK